MASFQNVGLSALTAYQRALATTAHNVANVDTPGYSRQVVDFRTQPPSYSGSGWSGSGVQVAVVRRQYDAFLAEQVRSSLGSSGEADVYESYATQLDNLFSDPSLSLDPVLQDYFGALNGVANDPTSVAARQVLLAQGEVLVDRFHFHDRRMDEIARGVNLDIEAAVKDINGYAKSIAELNDAIVGAAGFNSGQPPNDLLDQRDELVNRLSSLVNVTYYAQDDGALNVFIGKGQALVIGNKAQTLAVTSDEADTSQRRILFGTGAATRDITADLSGGEVGGLLRIRSQLIEPSKNQLGLVAVGVADAINRQHRLGLDLTGAAGGDFFNAPAGVVLDSSRNNGTGSVSISLTDVSALRASDYRLDYDGTDYTLTRLADGATWTNPATVDGFTLSITAGAAAGDSFLIQPVKNGAAEIGMAISNVNGIAAASPGGGTSDNRNALALAALQRTRVLSGGSATLQDGYAQAVSDIGARTRQAQVNAEAQRGLLYRAQESFSEVSGVNLDEEAANLIHFQQVYQAAAQVMAMSQRLFETLLNAVGR